MSLCLIIVASWIYQFPTLGQQLREHHSFRQTQTAFQTLSLSEGWGTILRPGMPVLGQPWQVPFEFPLFQQSAALIMKIFSLDIDFANRSTSLTWFSLCVLMIYHISRFFVGRFPSIISSIAFSISPLSLQWSRASLIEYCALFFSLFFLYSALRLLHRQRAKVQWGLVCIFSGVLAGLVKSTTFLVFCGIAVILTLAYLKSLSAIQTRKIEVSLISFASMTSFFGIFLWNSHADRIKNQSKLTSFLNSNELREWNFGTLAQRKVMSNWDIILDRINSYVLPIWLIALGIVFLLVAKRHRWISLTLLASVIVTILIFFNLYVVHDYYLVALSAQFAILVGLMVDCLLSFQRLTRIRYLTAFLMLFVVSYSSISQGEYRQLSRGDLPSFSNELVNLSGPDQRIFIAGYGWEPTILYYLNRRGIALDDRGVDMNEISRMSDISEYDFYQGPLWFEDVIRLRGWFAPVGQYTLRLDDNPTEIYTNLVVGMKSKLEQVSRAWKNQLNLDCRIKESLQIDTLPIDVEIQMKSIGDNRLSFGDSLVDSPTGDVLVRRDAQNTKIEIQQVGCDGDGEIALQW